MNCSVLESNRAMWDRKPAVRAIYRDYYRRIMSHCIADGISLELGGGTGNFKQHKPDLVTTDLSFTQWVDVVADAQILPFANGTFSNVVGVDVLHHVENPLYLFDESQRVLRPGGRLILLEPAITNISTIFYRLFHREPVNMSVRVTNIVDRDSAREPFDANQGIPTLAFTTQYPDLIQAIPNLELINLDWVSLFTYPMSGGFQRWCLIPEFLAEQLISIDRLLEKSFGRFGAFRLLAVLAKKS